MICQEEWEDSEGRGASVVIFHSCRGTFSFVLWRNRVLLATRSILSSSPCDGTSDVMDVVQPLLDKGICFYLMMGLRV